MSSVVLNKLNPFVRNPNRMIPLVVAAKTFGCRPSDMVDGLDGYTAYCLDESAVLYLSYLKDGKKPIKEFEDATEFL